jgi:transposase-like protein
MLLHGYREILAVNEGTKEDRASWTEFLRGLKQRITSPDRWA